MHVCNYLNALSVVIPHISMEFNHFEIFLQMVNFVLLRRKLILYVISTSISQTNKRIPDMFVLIFECIFYCDSRYSNEIQQS